MRLLRKRQPDVLPSQPCRGTFMPIKHILVVDDSPTERHFLSDLLTRHGYSVKIGRAHV